MIKSFEERHGVRIVQAWGMTETAPTGCVSNVSTELEELTQDAQYDYRARQGRPIPFFEVRARGDEGLVPWDGRSQGELEVRGPWVARAYFNRQDRTIVSLRMGGCEPGTSFLSTRWGMSRSRTVPRT